MSSPGFMANQAAQQAAAQASRAAQQAAQQAAAQAARAAQQGADAARSAAHRSSALAAQHAALRARQAGRPGAIGTFARVVRFIVGMMVFAVVVVVGLLVLGVDPQAFGAVLSRLRQLF